MRAAPVTVESLRPLIEIMASERTKERPDLWEDAVQEGLIRAWRVLTDRPGSDRAYVTAAARRGVGDVLRGRPLTGEEGRRGYMDAADHSDPLVVETADGEEFATEPADASAEDAFLAVDYRDEVRAAVGRLEPEDRDVVFLRYWRDLGYREISPIVGKPAGTLSRRWTETIRPRLREDLAPLAAA